jgi:alpha-tubulin suppressor-like RCC1 family protein
MTRSGRYQLSLNPVGGASRRLTAGLAGLVAASVLVALGTGEAVAPAWAAGAARAQAPPAAASTVSALAWGDDSAGELGDGTLTGSEVPVSVAGLSGVQAIAAGGRHDLALLSNGTVMAWGDDTFGQLGNGVASANGDSEAPAPVSGLSGVTAVAAGDEHSLALLSNGTVMAWGDNADGQLGDGSTAGSAVPVAVKGLTGVTAIAAGSLFSLALLSNGTVMSWGSNLDGQLGDDSETNSDVPVPVQGLTGVTAISAGGRFALALLSGQTVMSWGDNSNDQLGDGMDVSTQPLSTVPVPVVSITGVEAVSAGFQHAAALLSDGTVMVWGDNSFFQLARPNGFPGGISDSDTPLTVPGLPKATSIATGGLFSLAIVAGGKVKSWGDDSFGQLGNGSDATGSSVVTVSGLSGVTALAAGGESALALDTSGGTTTAAVTGPVSSPWRVAGSPVDPASDGITDDAFNAVSATSAKEAWAVGASNELADPQPLAEHWNGTSWKKVPVPLPATATTGTLDGVLELSPCNVWAVGNINAQTGTGELTLIEHWNGTKWSVVASPNPETGTGTSDGLTAIAGTSPTNMWAVGSFGTDVFNAMLFEHWNGKKWSFVPPPSEDEEFGEAVTAISADDAWAVGETAGGTISAHWNGTAWSFVATPILSNGNGAFNELTGVTAVSADDVWASGYEGDVDQQNLSDPYVLHWNGTAWSLTKVPDVGTEGSELRGIAALSAGDVWASGETLQDDGSLLSLTEHFNGSAWSVAPSLDPGELPPGIDNTFGAISATSPHTLFAVGAQEIPNGCCLRALAERTTKG